MNLLNSKILSYKDWANSQEQFVDPTHKKYLEYLNSWYDTNSRSNVLGDKISNKKQQYVQLVKDLMFLFNTDERNTFLSDVDYSKDEDLIYIIPYLAFKLKEISQILCSKREEIKKSKLKHSLAGSTEALERVLYEYILKNYTQKEYSYTRVPVSPLLSFFPELSSINSDFFVEVEELYDKNNYFDSDPSIPISNYLNINDLVDTVPFSSLSENELYGILSTRFLPKIANNPLSNVFLNYLTVFPDLSSLSITDLNANIQNNIIASKKYLGENVYGLTAIKTSDLNKPNYILNLDFAQGNSSFYWPTGNRILQKEKSYNIFKPININDSNLTLNRSVSGLSYLDSDLIFTDKNGIIEGAWLQGLRQETVKDNVDITFNGNEVRGFLFPFVGFTVDRKTLNFKSYAINDNDYNFYQKLDPTIKEKLSLDYFTNNTSISSSYDIFLNQTTLEGGVAGFFSDQTNTITKSNITSLSSIENVDTEKAYYYKFQKTDLYVQSGLTDIIWPVTTYNANSTDLPITLNAETCLPIKIKDENPSFSLVGSIAGKDFNSSDVIYKLEDKNGSNAVEAAWLGSGSITCLNLLKNSIPIYSSAAIYCSEYIDGPIQPSLSFKANPSNKISFVWNDEDTPADAVFKYIEHTSDCPFGKTFPHDFYKDQTYQNKNQLNMGLGFPLNQNKCTCNAVYYSPIGSEGNSVYDYNGMADYLFADPFGTGVDFTLSDWKDTRGLTVNNSPQFSFYQIDGTKDKQVGFGTGRWKTGNGSPMILKTGRRYTYYRNSLRKNTTNNSDVPFLVVNYPYKNITANCCNTTLSSTQVDLVILIDNSKTQTLDISIVKDLVKNLCSTILTTNTTSLISIISFASDALVLNYLTTDNDSIVEYIDNISIPTDYEKYQTNIYDALVLANNVLTKNFPINNDCYSNNILDLCQNVQYSIINKSKISTNSNCPRRNASKKVIIFSDGQETVNVGKAIPYANTLKNNGIEIVSMDIGMVSGDNDLMEIISSNDNDYYNLQKYLNNTDANTHTLIQSVASNLAGCFPLLPIWCKAVKNSSGAWIGLNEPSDMILRPGDYIAYLHQNNIAYTSQNTGGFNTPNISFTINIKLDGWDYDTNIFDSNNVGESYGGKPFWAKCYTISDSVNSFLKVGDFGGYIRFLENYVLVHQPEVSEMILSNNCYLEYNNITDSNIRWLQPIDFNCFLTKQQWNKLLLTEEISNFSEYLRNGNLLDLVVYQTYEPSDIILESYSEFKPVKYNYYAREPFSYKEDLYFIDSCENTFSILASAVIIQPYEPYKNLNNIHFPTVATLSFPSGTVSVNDVGSYLTPDKLGVSYYRGKGYSINVNPYSLSHIDSLSAERIFFDLNKYGPRNRGLTKKDQITPVEISNIDNSWIMQQYNAGYTAGVVADTISNQKLTPYQTNYEININNQIGISLQSDNFQFWDPYLYKWINSKNYPLSLRNEILSDSYQKKIDSLLVDKGLLSFWKNDIFGNNYGLFKKDYTVIPNNNFNYIFTENLSYLTQEINDFIIQEV